jgi:hypothetical protein
VIWRIPCSHFVKQKRLVEARFRFEATRGGDIAIDSISFWD